MSDYEAEARALESAVCEHKPKDDYDDDGHKLTHYAYECSLCIAAEFRRVAAAERARAVAVLREGVTESRRDILASEQTYDLSGVGFTDPDKHEREIADMEIAMHVTEACAKAIEALQ